ncbi:MAG: hypothetical protein MJ207_03330 [Bacilli bacterium]|nr:hypothetical protein [Bacilli bacterium]
MKNKILKLPLVLIAPLLMVNCGGNKTINVSTLMDVSIEDDNNPYNLLFCVSDAFSVKAGETLTFKINYKISQPTMAFKWAFAHSLYFKDELPQKTMSQSAVTQYCFQNLDVVKIVENFKYDNKDVKAASVEWTQWEEALDGNDEEEGKKFINTYINLNYDQEGQNIHMICSAHEKVDESKPRNINATINVTFNKDYENIYAISNPWIDK